MSAVLHMEANRQFVNFSKSMNNSSQEKKGAVDFPRSAGGSLEAT